MTFLDRISFELKDIIQTKTDFENDKNKQRAIFCDVLKQLTSFSLDKFENYSLKGDYFEHERYVYENATIKWPCYNESKIWERKECKFVS